MNEKIQYLNLESKKTEFVYVTIYINISRVQCHENALRSYGFLTVDDSD